MGADGAPFNGADGAPFIGVDGDPFIGADGATFIGADGDSFIGGMVNRTVLREGLDWADSILFAKGHRRNCRIGPLRTIALPCTAFFICPLDFGTLVDVSSILF